MPPRLVLQVCNYLLNRICRSGHIPVGVGEQLVRAWPLQFVGMVSTILSFFAQPFFVSAGGSIETQGMAEISDSHYPSLI